MTQIDDSESGGDERERTTMDDPAGTSGDATVRREEDAAAAEAGAIGGVAPDAGDEAERPVAEAGGGEAEGFEQSEDELVEQASHGENRYDPEADAFEPEAESDRSGAEYSEPDQVDIEDRGAQ